MRGPGDSKVSALTVLKCFTDEEIPFDEPDTQVSKRHLITPFRDINADKRCFFLETFHRLRMLTLFLAFSKNAPCCSLNICDFLGTRKSLYAWERLFKSGQIRSGWGGALLRILLEMRVQDLSNGPKQRVPPSGILHFEHVPRNECSKFLAGSGGGRKKTDGDFFSQCGRPNSKHCVATVRTKRFCSSAFRSSSI